MGDWAGGVRCRCPCTCQHAGTCEFCSGFMDTPPIVRTDSERIECLTMKVARLVDRIEELEKGRLEP